MDPERIVGALLRGVLAGRPKRHRGALGYLKGSPGSLLDAGSLLTAAGLAWGAYEAATSRSAEAAGPPPLPGGPPPLPVPSPASGPPPLPAAGPGPEATRRLVRLLLSAARADGDLGTEEIDLILRHAREAGGGALVEEEVGTPRPLAEIVAGARDPHLRADLYRLAFSVVRADESVTGGERVYLAQLAHLLDLGPEEVARVEADAAAGIDRAAREETT